MKKITWSKRFIALGPFKYFIKRGHFLRILCGIFTQIHLLNSHLFNFKVLYDPHIVYDLLLLLLYDFYPFSQEILAGEGTKYKMCDSSRKASFPTMVRWHLTDLS